MMEQNKHDISLGRFLSLVLRHEPSAAYLQLDANGWADVAELLDGCRRAHKPLSMEELEKIVRDNDKQRYCFNADHTKIRANQGHSIPVDVELQAKIPPDILYHGTASRFLDGIRAQGITTRTRQYVHLTTDLDTAVKVGSRHGKCVILVVDAAAMVRDGHTFFLSQNGVWLCKYVAWCYVREIQYP